MKNKNYLYALASGILMWLAWPPMRFTTPLVFIGLVPLLMALNDIIHSSRSDKGRRIFLTAGLCFIVFNILSTYWVYNAVSSGNNAVVSAVISLIPFGLGALLMTFPFWLAYRYRAITGGKYSGVFLLCLYVAMELLHNTWQLAFPWMSLGNALSGMHQLAQWYDITGVFGGSVWILACNLLAFTAVKNYRLYSGYMKYRSLYAFILVMAVPAAASLVKYYNYNEEGTGLNVVTVQPNIDPYAKISSLSAGEQLNTLEKLSARAAGNNTELIVWPETAIPYPINEDRVTSSAEYGQLQAFIAHYPNAMLLTGMESYKTYNTQQTQSAQYYPESREWFDHYNAALAMENSNKLQFYHKSKLVPGVERMPFPVLLGVLKPLFSVFGGTTGGYGWQDEPGVFYTYTGVGITPAICYESIWGAWIAASVKQGGQLIAVITNDGWWGNTSGKDQHFYYARLRAIENRRDVVRSANTGISGFINQRGDVVSKTKWWQPAVLSHNVQLNATLTPYTRNGDVIAWLCAVVSAAFIIYMLFIRLRRRRVKMGV